MTQNTVLVLGAGPRVGYSVARKFKAEGYQVAVGSRNPDANEAKEEGFLPFSVDLTDLRSVVAVFAQVKEKVAIPNVVVYNAAALTFPADIQDPFDVSPQAFVKDTGVNVIGAYTALNEAVKGFKELGTELPKAFIVTGNVLPFFPSAIGVTLGSGKTSLAHLINIGAITYQKSNFRFYFASQVTDEGKAVANTDLSGEAHGLVYWKLAGETKQGEWDVRFLSDGRVVPNKQ